MVRLMAIFSLACLVSAVVLVLRPDPWGKAEQKAAQDVNKLAKIMASPDRIGWRLSEDPALRRALIWDTDGTLKYPPPGGLTPLAYDFSEELIRRLRSLQSEVTSSEWSSIASADDELLYCHAAPAVCLFYSREHLEEALAVRSGALLSPGTTHQTSMLLFILACLFAGCGIWLWQRSAASVPTLKIIPERHVAIRGMLEVPLTPRDLKLLSLLVDRDYAVVTKDELYDAGWGRDYMPNSRALDQHMVNLRRKLDPDKSRPVLIETVHGVGYRLAK